MKERIPEEEFILIKENLLKINNVYKVTKKMVINFYHNMNKELDNLKFGLIDIEHPDDRNKTIELLGQQYSDFKTWLPYVSHGLRRNWNDYIWWNKKSTR